MDGYIKGALFIFIVFSAQQGAEMMWPDASPWMWWSLTAVAGFLFILIDHPLVKSRFFPSSVQVEGERDEKKPFFVWSYIRSKSRGARLVLEYILFFVVVVEVVPLYVETSGSTSAPRFFQIVYKIVGGLMVLHSAVAFIYDKKEESKADTLKRAAAFTLGCMMIAKAEELI